MIPMLQDMTGSHHTDFLYMMQALWVELVVLYGSYHIVVMSSDRLGFSVELVVLRSQSIAEIFGLSPQLGLEPAPHTSEAPSER